MLCGFSDHYADYARAFGISTDLAIRTMSEPDKTEDVKFDESFYATFFLKKFPLVKGSPSYLIYGQRLDDKFSANRAIRFYDDLCPDVDRKRPTEILYEIANRFGFQIRIKGIVDRFFFQHTYICEINDKIGPEILLTSEDPHLFESIFFQTRVEGKMRVQYSLAFALDISGYTAWVNSHCPAQISLYQI